MPRLAAGDPLHHALLVAQLDVRLGARLLSLATRGDVLAVPAEPGSAAVRVLDHLAPGVHPPDCAVGQDDPVLVLVRLERLQGPQHRGADALAIAVVDVGEVLLERDRAGALFQPVDAVQLGGPVHLVLTDPPAPRAHSRDPLGVREVGLAEVAGDQQRLLRQVGAQAINGRTDLEAELGEQLDGLRLRQPRGRREELEHALDALAADDGEAEAGPDPTGSRGLSPHEPAVDTYVLDPHRPRSAQDLARKSLAPGEAGLGGGDHERREAIGIVQVPQPGRDQRAGVMVGPIGVPHRPARERADEIERRLEHLVDAVRRVRHGCGGAQDRPHRHRFTSLDGSFQR